MVETPKVKKLSNDEVRTAYFLIVGKTARGFPTKGGRKKYEAFHTAIALHKHLEEKLLPRIIRQVNSNPGF